MSTQHKGASRMNEPTPKQWKSRALAAEEQVAIVQKMRAFDASRELEIARENAAPRVALKEIMESSSWAYGMIADKLGSRE